jgi:hypothetical protein
MVVFLTDRQRTLLIGSDRTFFLLIEKESKWSTNILLMTIWFNDNLVHSLVCNFTKLNLCNNIASELSEPVKLFKMVLWFYHKKKNGAFRSLVIYVCIENTIQDSATWERHPKKMKSGQRRHLPLLAAGRTPGLLQPMGPWAAASGSDRLGMVTYAHIGCTCSDSMVSRPRCYQPLYIYRCMATWSQPELLELEEVFMDMAPYLQHTLCSKF